MQFTEEFITSELGDYTRGFPTWGLRIAGTIDTELLNESKCKKCGHTGLECNPFINERVKSYRAFAVCPVCNEVEEY